MDSARLREQLERLGLRQGASAIKPQPSRQSQAIEELLSGEIVDTPNGSFFLHRERYEVAYIHGSHMLADLLAQPGDIAAYLARDERLYEAAVLTFDRLGELVSTLQRIAGKIERDGYITIGQATPVGTVTKDFPLEQPATRVPATP